MGFIIAPSVKEKCYLSHKFLKILVKGEKRRKRFKEEKKTRSDNEDDRTQWMTVEEENKK